MSDHNRAAPTLIETRVATHQIYPTLVEGIELIRSYSQAGPPQFYVPSAYLTLKYRASA